MIKKEDVFKIGRIGKAHGVKGEVTFQFDDDIFDRTDADSLFIEIDGLLVPFFIEEYRFRSDDVALMVFEGVDTEEKAEELTGCDVYFPRSLAGDDADSVSKAEIIGFQVIDSATGSTVGTISAVDDTTANPLFQVERDNAQVLIPASPELIRDVDRKARTITIAIPDGLLTM
jgi:16S rRNA processing protein RimM